jgi:hypothetical protein
MQLGTFNRNYLDGVMAALKHVRGKEHRPSAPLAVAAALGPVVLLIAAWLAITEALRSAQPNPQPLAR